MSNTIYYHLPYNQVLDYLKNVDNDMLDELYSKYRIEADSTTPEIEQLADVISDKDVQDLGFQPQKEESSEELMSEIKPEYKFGDVDDICLFLANNVDDYTVQSLLNQYNCYGLEDLAMALTDNELQSLGYNKTQASEQDGVENDDDDFEYHDSLDDFYDYEDYDENCDYLEDVPQEIKIKLIDPENGLFAVDTEEDFYRLSECINPVLVDECTKVDSDGSKVMFKIQPHKFEVQEDVIINDQLNPVIFNEDHTMIPEVKDQLLSYAQSFIAEMEKQGIYLDYSDIELVGSNAGYLYTPESDIDVHIVSSGPVDIDFAERLFDLFDLYEAENPLIIGDSRVELGLEDGYNITVDNQKTRKYSLVNDNWVDNSDELEQYEQGDLSLVKGYEDIVDNYETKINDFVDNDEQTQASNLLHEIRQNRSNDLANEGSLSMGNVVFKELRNKGAYTKLRDYIRAKELNNLNEQ